MATRGALRFPTMVQGDTEPPLVVRFRSEDTRSVPSGVDESSTCIFLMSGSDGLVVDGAGLYMGVEDGWALFGYNWQSGDTDVTGDFEGMFRVTLSNGRMFSSPRIRIHIDPVVGGA